MITKMAFAKTPIKTAVALAVTLGLSACSGSDNDADDIGIDDVTIDDIAESVPVDADIDAGIDTIAGGPGACPIVGNLIPLELAPGQCQISGQLTEAGALTADQTWFLDCLLYTSPSPRDGLLSRMPSSA